MWDVNGQTWHDFRPKLVWLRDGEGCGGAGLAFSHIGTAPTHNFAGQRLRPGSRTLPRLSKLNPTSADLGDVGSCRSDVEQFWATLADSGLVSTGFQRLGPIAGRCQRFWDDFLADSGAMSNNLGRPGRFRCACRTLPRLKFSIPGAFPRVGVCRIQPKHSPQTCTVTRSMVGNRLDQRARLGAHETVLALAVQGARKGRDTESTGSLKSTAAPPPCFFAPLLRCQLLWRISQRGYIRIRARHFRTRGNLARVRVSLPGLFRRPSPSTSPAPSQQLLSLAIPRMALSRRFASERVGGVGRGRAPQRSSSVLGRTRAIFRGDGA